ncbi:MAG: cobalt transport protein, partial [Humibacillus sp.]|nr:cobalt transport protein [Humibacillus sp.]
TVACGALAGAVVVAGSVQAWDGMTPRQSADLPAVPLLAVVAVLVALAPAWLTPRPREEVR